MFVKLSYYGLDGVFWCLGGFGGFGLGVAGLDMLTCYLTCI